MWSNIKNILKPPYFVDEEKALVSSLLNTIFLVFVTLALLINIILPIINPDANYLTSYALLVVSVGLFISIRFGGYRAVQVSSVVFCLALWVILTLNGWADEGLRNMATAIFFALTVAAGLLLGGKGAVVFGVLSIIGASIIFYGEAQGFIIFEPRRTTFYDLIKFVLVEITVMVLVRFAVTRLLQSLDKLRVSERMLAERADELGLANRKLRTLAKAKDDFVANVSHELRSPITSLMMYEDLLSRRPDRLDQYLPILRRETVRLGDLIEDLLNISQLDQGRIHLNLEAFDLNDLVKEYVIDRSPLAESRGLEINYLEVSDLPLIEGDRSLLGQSVSILLTNSLNYTPSGGQVYVRTETRYVDGHQWVGFVVHDTGPGISVEDQQNLFTRFYRGQIGRRSGVSGTGLGLAIAKEIIDRHRGRIEVRSEGVSGKGATFNVWLPVSMEREHPQNNHPS